MFITSSVYSVYWVIKNNYDVIGLIKNTNQEKTSLTQSTGGNRTPVSTKAATPNAEKQVASEKTSNVYSKVFINSEPSGASIFINNQSSSKYTPAFVTLTNNKTSNITLKKEGYFSKNFVFDPNKRNNEYLNIILTVNPKDNESQNEIHIIQ